MKYLRLTLTFCIFFSVLISFAQGQADTLGIDEPTILRRAGDYSAKHDVLAISVFRGTAYRKEYDRYLEILSDKLDSLKIPHKYFQKFYEDKPGTGFVYFIENDLNGSFDSNEMIALLPHIARRFRTRYPSKFEN